MEDTSVTVADVRSVGPDALALSLESPSDFDARPGQFVKFSTDIDGERASRFYSISSPRVDGTFELTVEIDPDGDVSPTLRGLGSGDTVVLSGPYGNAFYEDESSVLVLAGGPGIGPAVGIAERTREEGGEAAVVYRDDDPIHQERLDALADRGVAVHVLGDDDPLDVSTASVGLTDPQIFVYGFVEFLDDAMDAIAAAGGEPDRAKVENFG